MRREQWTAQKIPFCSHCICFIVHSGTPTQLNSSADGPCSVHNCKNDCAKWRTHGGSRRIRTCLYLRPGAKYLVSNYMATWSFELKT